MVARIELEIIIDGTILKEALISKIGDGLVEVKGDIIPSGYYLGITTDEVEKMISKRIIKDYNGKSRRVKRRIYQTQDLKTLNSNLY